MRKTKFAAALMIVTAGSALIGTRATAAEVIAARHPGHMPPPPREWREPPHHGGPGGHMPPPHEWDRGPSRPGGPGGPRDWDRGPAGPGGPGGHMPPPREWDRRPGGPGGPGGHMPPPPRERGVPSPW